MRIRSAPARSGARRRRPRPSGPAPPAPRCCRCTHAVEAEPLAQQAGHDGRDCEAIRRASSADSRVRASRAALRRRSPRGRERGAISGDAPWRAVVGVHRRAASPGKCFAVAATPRRADPVSKRAVRAGTPRSSPAKSGWPSPSPGGHIGHRREVHVDARRAQLLRPRRVRRAGPRAAALERLARGRARGARRCGCRRPPRRPWQAPGRLRRAGATA